MQKRLRPTRRRKNGGKPSKEKHVKDIEQRRFESAAKDRLTNTYNKSYLLDRIESDLAYAKRHQTGLTLMLFGINNFKKIDKLFGRGASDYVLQKLAATLKQTTRNEDVLARLGGDALAVLVRDAAVEKIMVLAERLCQVIAQTNFEFKGRSITITVSTGIGIVGETPNPLIQTPQDMVNCALQSLQQIKSVKVE